jgi:hypothetical protein
MVFAVEVVTGPTADLLARAQLDVMREICAWVAQRRAGRRFRLGRGGRAPGQVYPNSGS